MNEEAVEVLARAAMVAVEEYGEYVDGATFKRHVHLGESNEIEVLVSNDIAKLPFVKISVEDLIVFDADFDSSGEALERVYEYLPGDEWEEAILQYRSNETEE